jgi:hypothetical protein
MTTGIPSSPLFTMSSTMNLTLRARKLTGQCVSTSEPDLEIVAKLTKVYSGYTASRRVKPGVG